MSKAPPNDLLNEALRLAGFGYRVFPLEPQTKTPRAGSRGVLDATTDADSIRDWWRQSPDSNIGLACGDGLLALDVDPGAIEAFGAEEVANLEFDWIGKPRSRTPRGRFHLLMREPEGVALRNSAGKIGQGLDIKCAGGYIVAPPSRVIDPARNIDGVYEWIEPFDSTPDVLPDAPAWLVQALTETNANLPALTGSTNVIPEGSRNDALASIAGHLRHVGLDDRAIAAALHAVNSERCQPPLEEREIERIAASIARYEPRIDLVSETVSGVDLSEFMSAPSAPPDDPLEPAIVSIGDLVKAYPALRPPVIHGLLREGETMNVIAAPKTGKSWLTLDLAIAVATGRPWLGKYPTESGDVLIIDNELHPETSVHRIPKVAQARKVAMRQIASSLFIDNLRGRLRDMHQMAAYFDFIEPGRFTVIVLDAFYRFIPREGDENDNGTMRDIYNSLDSYAIRLGCCFVLIHHSIKGNQSVNAVTDVGAGAGAQSRAADAHLVLRPHEEDDAVVLDAAVRSWPRIEPVCLRWSFPVWSVDETLDPNELKTGRPKKRKDDDDGGADESAWTAERFVDEFITNEPITLANLKDHALRQAGLSRRWVGEFLDAAERNRLVDRLKMPGRGGPTGYVKRPKKDGDK